MKWFNRSHKTESLIRARDISSRLPDILLSAQKITQSLLRGQHGRRQTGSGDHFWQYRLYDPETDSAARIDWRRSGRSDHVFVRELEDERPRKAAFWIDPSESMHYSSHPDKIVTKYDYGFTAACVLAYALTEASEQVGVENKPMGVSHVQGVQRWAETLLRGQKRPDFSGLRQTHIIIVSDFLDFTRAEIETLSKSLRISGNRLTVLIPVDPAEDGYPFDGHIKFETVSGRKDFETQNAKSLRDEYLKRFHAHQQGIVKAFGRENCFFGITSQPLQGVALDVVRHLRAH